MRLLNWPPTISLSMAFGSSAFAAPGGRGWSKRRGDVFRDVLANSGYTCHGYQLPSFYGKTWFVETERQRMAQWIETLPKPIGIMAANDWAGEKVLEACRQVGAMVPEEVAVIGVDNDPVICEIADPMLSSINAHHDRVGFQAAELLDSLMKGKRPPTEPLTVSAGYCMKATISGIKTWRHIGATTSPSSSKTII